MRKSWLLVVGASVALVGCHQLPNPNNLAEVEPQFKAARAHELLAAFADTMAIKVEKQRVTDEQRTTLIKEHALELLKEVDVSKTFPDDAWKLAELFRTVEDWDSAATQYERALRAATTPDRIVTDSLRFAQCLAHQGKYERAVEYVERTFDAGPRDSAPILPSLLYEVAPALKGHVSKEKLTKLISRAVRKHQSTEVDIATEEGKMFHLASRTHYRRAQTFILGL